MDSNIPVWLSTGKLLEKYHTFCYQHHFTDRFLVRLLDAQLVRGHNNRKSKHLELLESSFLELLHYINCNLAQQLFPTEEENIPVPAYCTRLYAKRIIPLDYPWYSASEILDAHRHLHDTKVYTIAFINELVERNLLIGRYDKSHKQALILKPSFQALMHYRNDLLEQLKYVA